DGKTRLLSYNLTDLQAGDPSMQGGTVDVFIEPLLPPPTVLVVGCGHVGKAVAELAKWMDFRVIVSDDRPGYATPEQIPGMDGYVEAAPAELTQHVTIDHVTCVAAITRGVIVDQDLLPPLLATDAPYIGVIGGRRRWLLTSKTLQEAGISPETLMRVRTPVGLDLGGETPKEIALSILAEIVMVLRNGTGQPLKSQ
ncbi:MAG: XdhC family protein, partial [Anaerolineae bacterium]|nr:XdhC family protein [Anaerolineae bacterium]